MRAVAIYDTKATDPIFGPILHNPIEFSGWAFSLADGRFARWGAEYAARFPDRPTGDATSPKPWQAGDEEAFDACVLRRAGRILAVIRSNRDAPPTATHRAAWLAFRDADPTLADRVAEAIVETFRGQRAERLRWWQAVYDDAPDSLLPEITTPDAIREIVRASEYRVYPENVGVVFEASWLAEDLEVVTGDDTVVAVRPVDRDSPAFAGPQVRSRQLQIESPLFGMLRHNDDDAWVGTYRSPLLRGWSSASEVRDRARQPGMEGYYAKERPLPPWAAIVGEVPLSIFDEGGDGATAAQVRAFESFTADRLATERCILTSIAVWYGDRLAAQIARSGDDPDDANASMPALDSSEGLLELIELQSVDVRGDPDDGSQPAIVLTFGWADEHGIGVRWRNGVVEVVGFAEEADE